MESIFTKIINNDLPSYKIYEDSLLIVILDINPTTNGDMLVIPKDKIVEINELNDELLVHMHHIIIKMKSLVEEKLNAKGLTVLINNGHGQEIKHLHVHLTPRFEDDEVTATSNKSILKDLKEIHETLVN